MGELTQDNMGGWLTQSVVYSIYLYLLTHPKLFIDNHLKALKVLITLLRHMAFSHPLQEQLKSLMGSEVHPDPALNTTIAMVGQLISSPEVNPPLPSSLQSLVSPQELNAYIHSPKDHEYDEIK